MADSQPQPVYEQWLDLVWLNPTWLLDERLQGYGVWLVPFYEGLLAVAVLALAGAVLRFFFPKMAAVASTTMKEALSQPLFYVLLAASIFLLAFLFPFLPYNTFGEDIKMVKDSSLTLIMIASIGLGLWTASVSISEEIEGRTAITLLSKPISRRHFVIGKLLGIIGAIAANFIILGTIFLMVICYKVGFDARYDAALDVNDTIRLESMVQVLPGLVLAFYEAVILSSIAVAISTRLPMLANLMICGTIYVLGHLTPLIVESTSEAFEPVKFIAQLIAVVLPNLDHFQLQAAIAGDREIPLLYLAAAGLQTLIYTTIMTCLALVLFEDRDLA